MKSDSEAAWGRKHSAEETGGAAIPLATQAAISIYLKLPCGDPCQLHPVVKYGWCTFDPAPPGVHLVSCLASGHAVREVLSLWRMNQQDEPQEQILINNGQMVEDKAVDQDKIENLLPALYPSDAPAGNC